MFEKKNMFWIIVIILIVVCILAGIAINASDEKWGVQLNNTLSSLGDFQVSNKITGVNNSYIFVVDEINKKIIFITEENHIRTIKFEDIISVELLENNSIISKKSTLRILGGGLIGGAVAGGAGAVVGGLSGSSKNKKMVSTVSIKILLKNIHNPNLVIKCFDSKTMLVEGKKEVDVSKCNVNYIYEACISQANRIKDIVSVIIELNDEKYATEQISESDGNNMTISDEIEKLHKLKEKGIISEEEFTNQKRKLLNL